MIPQRIRALSLFIAVGAAVAVLDLSAAGAASPASKALVRALPEPSANPAGSHGLSDASVLSASDVWAVGSRGKGGAASLTWVRHWDGVAWTHVRSPSPGNQQNELRSVSAVSPTDVWAIGAQRDVGDDDERPLVEHWDGTSWTVVDTPATTGRAYGGSASGPNDVWVVGDRYQNPIAEHWDGTVWTDTQLELPAVTPPYQVTLMLPYDVVTLGPKNAWLIGIYDAQNGDGGYQREILAEHWDGSSWHVVALPHQANWSYPFAISASSARNVWAVGVTDFGRDERPFVAHFDGRTWTTTSQSDEAYAATWLRGVSPIAPDDVWAVGFRDARRSQPFAEHWDGSQWTTDDSVDPGARYATLLGVDSAASDDVIAVGGLGTRKKAYALTERWDGSSWHQLP